MRKSVPAAALVATALLTSGCSADLTGKVIAKAVESDGDHIVVVQDQSDGEVVSLEVDAQVYARATVGQVMTYRSNSVDS